MSVPGSLLLLLTASAIKEVAAVIVPVEAALVPIVAKDVVNVLCAVAELLPFGLKNTVPSELVDNVAFVSLEVK